MEQKITDELGQLAQALRVEQKEDFELHKAWLEKSNIQERKKNGVTWFPLRIIETGYGLGAYPFMVVERNTTDQQYQHKFQNASPVNLFSAAPGNEQEGINGVVGYVDGQRMKITFYTDELPDWTDDGKLGVNVMFDTKTYDEMFKALNYLINVEKGRTRELRDIILGAKEARFISPKIQPHSALLNESQNEALRSIVAATDIAAVHGPPGTGKTTTLVETISELLKEEKQILVCAPSNAATDHLAGSLRDKGLRVVRIGNLAKVEQDNSELTIDALLNRERDFKQIKELKKRAVELRKMGGKYKRSFGREEAEQRKLIMQEAKNLNKEARELENYLVEKVLDNAQVIACTLIGSASNYLEDRKFSTVVIDEAGQGIEPAVWVPILKAEKVVLAGDPFQLPPTVKSRNAEKMGLTITLLEKVIKRHTRVDLLRTQYRMNEQIMAFSNRKFYDNKLEAADAVRNWTIEGSEQVVEFIDTAGCGFEEKPGESNESLCNPGEIDIIKKHLELLPGGNYSIGIISPYRAQVELLEEAFGTGKNKSIEDESELHTAKKKDNITVNTVDSFQGQERDIIYISLVRSNETGEIGFLRDYRRMNVAMTRARKKLVIVGDSATLGNDRFYSEFLEYAESIGAYKTAWEFLY